MPWLRLCTAPQACLARPVQLPHTRVRLQPVSPAGQALADVVYAEGLEALIVQTEGEIFDMALTDALSPGLPRHTKAVRLLVSPSCRHTPLLAALANPALRRASP